MVEYRRIKCRRKCVNINGRACLLRLQPYMVSRVGNGVPDVVFWPCLTVCALRRVNLVELNCICGKVLYSKDWPIIFTDVCLIGQNRGVISIF